MKHPLIMVLVAMYSVTADTVRAGMKLSSPHPHMHAIVDA